MIAPRSGEDYADRMKTASCIGMLVVSFAFLLTATGDDALPKAFIDGNGPGWKALGEADFVNVNCASDTWSFNRGVIHCTGQPVGVTRTREPLGNFELVVQWRHLRAGGNSGIFVWAAEKSLEGLKPG